MDTLLLTATLVACAYAFLACPVLSLTFRFVFMNRTYSALIFVQWLILIPVFIQTPFFVHAIFNFGLNSMGMISFDSYEILMLMASFHGLLFIKDKFYESKDVERREARQYASQSKELNTVMAM
jgi:hypothetical protein